jgi:putative flavoprotein involved in K+ transport
MRASVLRNQDRCVTAVVIGGGQCGLASSQQLTQQGIDHVVLERGEIANSWLTERWDSLQLLTPNWQTRLPGYHYRGDDPDGFMSMPEVATFIKSYSEFCSAPVHTGTRVSAVESAEDGYVVRTDRGNWRCKAVVLASGPYNIPVVPGISEAIPAKIDQLNPHQYRNPDQLHTGGVLVVGASATGMQMAREIQQSGRQVTVAVSEHLRMPRSYRGRDIEYWMHATGLLDESYHEVDDIERLRNLPSPQLIGHPDHINLDINSLGEHGVKFVGRLVGIQGSHAQFSGSLTNAVKMADLKQQRFLASIDEWINACGNGIKPATECSPEPTYLDGSPRLSIDLNNGEIATVIWATGFRPDYSWLNVPVLDRRGRICHEGGITAAPGLYAMGLPFMRKRKSSFIFGAGDDAGHICAHLAEFIHMGHRGARVSAA